MPALRNRPHHGRWTERKAEPTEVSSFALESGQAGAHGVCFDGKRQRQWHARPNLSTLETEYSRIGQIFAGCASGTGESRLLSSASRHCLCGWAGVSGPHGCMGLGVIREAKGPIPYWGCYASGRACQACANRLPEQQNCAFLSIKSWSGDCIRLHFQPVSLFAPKSPHQFALACTPRIAASLIISKPLVLTLNYATTRSRLVKFPPEEKS